MSNNRKQPNPDPPKGHRPKAPPGPPAKPTGLTGSEIWDKIEAAMESLGAGNGEINVELGWIDISWSGGDKAFFDALEKAFK